MSLHVAAQHLASKGRDGDSTLVHMSPNEVNGLQAIAMAHGGSLSINPDTGLVEASFLKRLIPMAAGAALSPFITPMGAAALVGGIEGFRTGDIGRGLTAGLGAYGGAGLTSGLTAGASSAATETAAANALGVPASAGATATGATSQAGMLAAENTAMGLTPAQSAAQISGSAGYAAGAAPMSSAMQTANLASSGFGQLGTEAGRSAVYNAMPTGTLPATATAVTAAALEPKPQDMSDEEYESRYPELSLSKKFRGYTPASPNPYYRPTGLGYAMGGQVDPMQRMPNGGLAALQSMRDGYGSSQTMDGNIPQMAGGGSLGGYSDGGRMLRGPGDGMSDSIPATINKRQPARLADGEFVVPADVVSHLGNGSTDAGAKKLYAMMDKVRVARTGKKKQAPAVKSNKYLPV